MRSLIDYYFVTCAHEKCTTIGHHSIGPVLVAAKPGEEVTKWVIAADGGRAFARRRARGAAVKMVHGSLKLAGQLYPNSLLDNHRDVQRLIAGVHDGFYAVVPVRGGVCGQGSPILAS